MRVEERVEAQAWAEIRTGPRQELGNHIAVPKVKGRTCRAIAEPDHRA